MVKRVRFSETVDVYTLTSQPSLSDSVNDDVVLQMSHIFDTLLGRYDEDSEASSQSSQASETPFSSSYSNKDGHPQWFNGFSFLHCAADAKPQPTALPDPPATASTSLGFAELEMEEECHDMEMPPKETPKKSWLGFNFNKEKPRKVQMVSLETTKKERSAPSPAPTAETANTPESGKKKGLRAAKPVPGRGTLEQRKLQLQTMEDRISKHSVFEKCAELERVRQLAEIQDKEQETSSESDSVEETPVPSEPEESPSVPEVSVEEETPAPEPVIVKKETPLSLTAAFTSCFVPSPAVTDSSIVPMPQEEMAEKDASVATDAETIDLTMVDSFTMFEYKSSTPARNVPEHSLADTCSLASSAQDSVNSSTEEENSVPETSDAKAETKHVENNARKPEPEEKVETRKAPSPDPPTELSWTAIQTILSDASSIRPVIGTSRRHAMDSLLHKTSAPQSPTKKFQEKKATKPDAPAKNDDLQKREESNIDAVSEAKRDEPPSDSTEVPQADSQDQDSVAAVVNRPQPKTGGISRVEPFRKVHDWKLAEKPVVQTKPAKVSAPDEDDDTLLDMLLGDEISPIVIDDEMEQKALHHESPSPRSVATEHEESRDLAEDREEMPFYYASPAEPKVQAESQSAKPVKMERKSLFRAIPSKSDTILSYSMRNNENPFQSPDGGRLMDAIMRARETTARLEEHRITLQSSLSHRLIRNPTDSLSSVVQRREPAVPEKEFSSASDVVSQPLAYVPAHRSASSRTDSQYLLQQLRKRREERQRYNSTNTASKPLPELVSDIQSRQRSNLSGSIRPRFRRASEIMKVINDGANE